MTDPEIPPLHDDLIFHGPLSESRADQLVRSLGPLAGRHVVDLGCGWAEFLLRAVATDPTATGHGVDLDQAAIEHGRAAASARGLGTRVTLEVGDAGAWSGSADILIVNGASQVFGGEPTRHTVNALEAGKRLLRPGGRLLLGEGFWEREPSAENLRRMPITREEYRSMADLVDLTTEHGYRPLWISQASLDEWDTFQSQHALGWEKWLSTHQGHPAFDEVKAKADTHRSFWLHGWRTVLGMAYLTLALA
ncbi:class I SAM-dependent methyltransferase [Actinokineospora auranticolor]|nr:class I SAM-dependent methyltransferase [Actinokineospora auranticolor]